MRDDAGADRRRLHLAQLEGERRRDVALLDRGLADIELASLAVMVRERLGTDAERRPLLLGGVGAEALVRRFARPSGGPAPGVRLVVRPSLRVDEGHVPVLLE